MNTPPNNKDGRSSEIHGEIHQFRELLEKLPANSPAGKILLDGIKVLLEENAGLDCQMMWVCSKCCPSGVTVE
jgi:hypothetical protein